MRYLDIPALSIEDIETPDIVDITEPISASISGTTLTIDGGNKVSGEATINLTGDVTVDTITKNNIRGPSIHKISIKTNGLGNFTYVPNTGVTASSVSTTTKTGSDFEILLITTHDGDSYIDLDLADYVSPVANFSNELTGFSVSELISTYGASAKMYKPDGTLLTTINSATTGSGVNFGYAETTPQEVVYQIEVSDDIGRTSRYNVPRKWVQYDIGTDTTPGFEKLELSGNEYTSSVVVPSPTPTSKAKVYRKNDHGYVGINFKMQGRNSTDNSWSDIDTADENDDVLAFGDYLYQRVWVKPTGKVNTSVSSSNVVTVTLTDLTEDITATFTGADPFEINEVTNTYVFQETTKIGEIPFTVTLGTEKYTNAATATTEGTAYDYVTLEFANPTLSLTTSNVTISSAKLYKDDVLFHTYATESNVVLRSDQTGMYQAVVNDVYYSNRVTPDFTTTRSVSAPQLNFDGYNKLSLSNIIPTSTSLQLGANTYAIGTASNIYILNSGTYTAMVSNESIFAYLSTVVGTVSQHPTDLVPTLTFNNLNKLTVDNVDSIDTVTIKKDGVAFGTAMSSTIYIKDTGIYTAEIKAVDVFVLELSKEVTLVRKSLENIIYYTIFKLGPTSGTTGWNRSVNNIVVNGQNILTNGSYQSGYLYTWNQNQNTNFVQTGGIAMNSLLNYQWIYIAISSEWLNGNNVSQWGTNVNISTKSQRNQEPNSAILYIDETMFLEESELLNWTPANSTWTEILNWNPESQGQGPFSVNNYSLNPFGPYLNFDTYSKLFIMGTNDEDDTTITDPSGAMYNIGTANTFYIKEAGEYELTINGMDAFVKSNVYIETVSQHPTDVVPSLTFDNFNKLTIENITPMSTTLEYGSNTYYIGTATDIYIKEAGTYQVATGNATTFALVSNVVTGTPSSSLTLPSQTYDSINKITVTDIPTDVAGKIYKASSAYTIDTTTSQTNVIIKNTGTYVSVFTTASTAYLTNTIDVTATPTSTGLDDTIEDLIPLVTTIVFHHGIFTIINPYGDSDVNTAAIAGHIYSDTPMGTYTWGVLSYIKLNNPYGTDTAASSGGHTPGNTTYKWTPPGTITGARILLVGGGGGGGMNMGGGGGGGGFLELNGKNIPWSEQTVVVGRGGDGSPAQEGSRSTNAVGQTQDSALNAYTVPAYNGGNSSIGDEIAYGGGRGGYSHNADARSFGTNGGSGGGVSGYNANPNNRQGGTGVSGQGNRGGNSNTTHYSGGGGGAGAAGAGANNLPHGGDGLPSDILGTEYWWSGGGGGAGYSIEGGNGGKGGGGGGAVGTKYGGTGGLNAGKAGGGGSINSQTNTPGGDGGKHTGGGGGGGAHYFGNNYGGNGGSGIVIINFDVAILVIEIPVTEEVVVDAPSVTLDVVDIEVIDPIFEFDLTTELPKTIKKYNGVVQTSIGRRFNHHESKKKRIEKGFKTDTFSMELTANNVTGGNLVEYGNFTLAANTHISGEYTIAANYDGTTSNLYVNGSLISQTAISLGRRTERDLIIGKEYDGYIKNFKFWNYAKRFQ